MALPPRRKRRFRVSVEGRTFFVEVEEVGVEEEQEREPRGVSGAVPLQVVVQPPRTKPAEPPAAAGPIQVKAPIPGVILSVACKEGDRVKAGQRLLILESMKMENPIFSPRDGVVKKVLATPQVMVKMGEVLVEIE